MYLSVSHSRIDPAHAHAVLAAAGSIAAAIRQLPGCQDVRISGDRTTGRGITVATFDTLAHAQFALEAEGSSLAPLLAPLLALGLQLDAPEVYEIVS